MEYTSTSLHQVKYLFCHFTEASQNFHRAGNCVPTFTDGKVESLKDMLKFIRPGKVEPEFDPRSARLKGLYHNIHIRVFQHKLIGGVANVQSQLRTKFSWLQSECECALGLVGIYNNLNLLGVQPTCFSCSSVQESFISYDCMA